MSLIKRSNTTDNGDFPSQQYNLESHDGIVFTCKFSPDGDIIASGGMDQTIQLWTLPHSSTDPSNYGELRGHKSAVTTLSWLNNGNIVSGSADTTIGLWDPETGTKIRNFKGHELVINEIDVDNDKIVSASDDGSLKIWDSNTKTFIHNFKTDYPLLSAQFQQNLVFTSGIEPVIHSWDIRSTSEPLFELETHHTDTITSLSYSEGQLISKSNDNTIRSYSLTLPNLRINSQVYTGVVSSDSLLQRCLLRDNLIYSGSSDKTITTFEVTSGKLLEKINGHTGAVLGVDEHQGKLVSFGVDGVILRYL
ncbi:hypothetical protein WICMUC_000561 [Wickerhamomyces mucosus]|uniref:TEP-1 second beta-propeller domain-containing protein n=1 Tax=Wickerhamomyces mucosus TaxID=1378264 RepID=A0A9P8THT3_9ASCO|nr:hypothetical protein WICMUC_000561 [Wickerhamomyces mucosus]